MAQLPLIRFLVSSPGGDVPVDPDRLHLPLECDPLKTPYGVYFQAIGDFIRRKRFQPILGAAAEKSGRTVSVNAVREIVVRTEKHGSLYHPASVELVLNGSKIMCGLNVAVSETGRAWLRREYEALTRIHLKFDLPYLPDIYVFDDEGPMSFLLEDWFEGYHEFHLSEAGSGRQCVKLWEYGKGDRYLSDEESFEIYRQASRILTLYYDMDDFSQIFPWHHAAGDFIVKAGNGGIDLRLTTARQYEPYMVFREKEGMNPVLALFFFFLNLVLKMRLDRIDGTGDIAWAEDFCVEAAVKGFVEGLRANKKSRNYLDPEVEFLELLKSFGRDDFRTAYDPLVQEYEGAGDYPVIAANLEKHIEVLYAILQNFLS